MFYMSFEEHCEEIDKYKQECKIKGKVDNMKAIKEALSKLIEIKKDIHKSIFEKHINTKTAMKALETAEKELNLLIDLEYKRVK